MTNKYVTMTIATVAAAILLLSAGANIAWAHSSTNLPLPSDPNRGVKLTVGETSEPAYDDEFHNIDIIIRDKLTNMPVGNAHKKLDGTQGLKVDSYFYPKGTTPSVTGTEPGPLSPGPGFTDKKLDQSVRPQFGKLGSYSASSQFYTKVGLTLYHIYGVVNYYGDAEIPVDVWVAGDGHHGLAVKRGVSGSTTVTWSGGFGLGDRSDSYWPGSDGGVTTSNYPENIRDTLGSIKSDIAQLKADVAATKTNTVDIFNFLRQIAEGINQLLAGKTPITIPAAK
ncbi:hypothetical protein [Nitrososphaera sp.]|uniref:hypothetical protein n=1 Tax=Nitrososphaera sp. TaxID=1971748 RepID=UPI00307E3DF8